MAALPLDHGRHFDALVALSQRLAEGKAARIVTLGGSVPFGNNCVRPDGAHHQSCSWPNRLVIALRAAYPAALITHDNYAGGGNGVIHILSTLGIVLRERPDLVLLDSLVNDVWRSGSADTAQALEELIRATVTLLPSVALLVVEAAPPVMGDEVARAKRRVLQHYHVATLDWVAAATRSPTLWQPGPIAGTTATDVNHPNWQTHQQIADTVLALWGRASRRACLHAQADTTDRISRLWPLPSPLVSSEGPARFAVCLRPLSVYSSHDTGERGSRLPAFAHGWRRYADRPGKPGWIGDQPGSRIGFEIRLGIAPRFSVTFLRSYEHIGRVELALPAANFRVEVDALWGERKSQNDVLWFGTTEGHMNENTHYVPMLLPNSTHILEARLLDTPGRDGGNKFKILQVVSC